MKGAYLLLAPIKKWRAFRKARHVSGSFYELQADIVSSGQRSVGAGASHGVSAAAAGGSHRAVEKIAITLPVFIDAVCGDFR